MYDSSNMTETSSKGIFLEELSESCKSQSKRVKYLKYLDESMYRGVREYKKQTNRERKSFSMKKVNFFWHYNPDLFDKTEPKKKKTKSTNAREKRSRGGKAKPTQDSPSDNWNYPANRCRGRKISKTSSKKTNARVKNSMKGKKKTSRYSANKLVSGDKDNFSNWEESPGLFTTGGNMIIPQEGIRSKRIRNKLMKESLAYSQQLANETQMKVSAKKHQLIILKAKRVSNVNVNAPRNNQETCSQINNAYNKETPMNNHIDKHKSPNVFLDNQRTDYQLLKTDKRVCQPNTDNISSNEATDKKILNQLITPQTNFYRLENSIRAGDNQETKRKASQTGMNFPFGYMNSPRVTNHSSTHLHNLTKNLFPIKNGSRQNLTSENIKDNFDPKSPIGNIFKNSDLSNQQVSGSYLGGVIDSCKMTPVQDFRTPVNDTSMKTLPYETPKNVFMNMVSFDKGIKTNEDQSKLESENFGDNKTTKKYNSKNFGFFNGLQDANEQTQMLNTSHKGIRQMGLNTSLNKDIEAEICNTNGQVHRSQVNINNPNYIRNKIMSPSIGNPFNLGLRSPHTPVNVNSKLQNYSPNIGNTSLQRLLKNSNMKNLLTIQSKDFLPDKEDKFASRLNFWMDSSIPQRNSTKQMNKFLEKMKYKFDPNPNLDNLLHAPSVKLLDQTKLNSVVKFQDNIIPKPKITSRENLKVKRFTSFSQGHYDINEAKTSSEFVKLENLRTPIQGDQTIQLTLDDPDNKKEILDDISDTSFHPKQSSAGKKGCYCKQTECLKKYCSCFKNGASCSSFCECVNCENQQNSKKRQLKIREIMKRSLTDSEKKGRGSKQIQEMRSIFDTKIIESRNRRLVGISQDQIGNEFCL